MFYLWIIVYIILLIIYIVKHKKYNYDNFKLTPNDIIDKNNVIPISETYEYPTCTPGCLSIYNSNMLMEKTKYNISNNRCIYNMGKNISIGTLDNVVNYSLQPSNVIGFQSCSTGTNTMIESLDPKILPNQISNLTMWVDAQDINTIQYTTDSLNNKQFTWLDKSINKRNMVAAGTLPVYNSSGINKLPSLYFDRRGILTNNYSFQSKSFTIVTIYIDGYMSSFWSVAMGTNGGNFYPNYGGITYLGYTGGGSWLETASILSTSIPYLIIARYNAKTFTVLVKAWSFINRGTIIFNESYYDADGMSFYGGFGIGGGNPGELFGGHIGEIIIYEKSLTDIEITGLTNHLRTKWNMI